MFNGAFYSKHKDEQALMFQVERIKTVMLSRSEWLTLAQIEIITDDPQASISAQLRNLRKEKFGSYVLEVRRKEGTTRQYEYKLNPRGYKSEFVFKGTRSKLKSVLRVVYGHKGSLKQLRRDVKMIMT